MYNFTNPKHTFKNIEEWLSKEYSQVHAGRATPIFLDGIMVESYGAFVPIKNVASVGIEDPKTLRVAPWDKNHIKPIEKAISDANMGLSVVSDSTGLRVIFPVLTTETREKLIKILKEHLEEARVSVRAERETTNKAIDEVEKNGGMSEDEQFKNKEELQKLVTETNKNLEAIFEKKQAEIMN